MTIEQVSLIVSVILLLITAGAITITKFFKQPAAEQLKKVKEWLLLATAQAEKELGSGTGQLKLRYVYDLFLVRFGFLAKTLSFEQFSFLVDEALETLKRMLENNKAIQEYVENDENDKNK